MSTIFKRTAKFLFDGLYMPEKAKLIALLDSLQNPGGVRTLTATGPLVAGDMGGVLRMNAAGANSAQVPSNTGTSRVDFPIGAVVTIRQAGAGATTIAALGVSGVAELFTVTFAGTAAALANKYITFHDGTTARYAWFNLDAGGKDPGPSKRTGTEVALTTGMTVTQQAAAFVAAIDPLAAVSAANTAGVATVTNVSAGERFDAAAGTSGLAVNVTQQGVSAGAAPTLNTPAGKTLVLSGQGAEAKLRKVAANVWDVSGELTAA